MNNRRSTRMLRGCPARRSLATRARERGQATVEFAIVLPIFMTVLLAAVNLGSAYLKYQQLSAAASEGARKAIVLRTDSDRTSKITTAIQNAAPSLNLTSSNIAISSSSSWAYPGDVTISLTYNVNVNLLFGSWTAPLTATRTMRLEE